jgi:hypothetical protein
VSTRGQIGTEVTTGKQTWTDVVQRRLTPKETEADDVNGRETETDVVSEG